MPASAKPRSAHAVLATITSKGQVTIPVEVRRTLGVRAGDKIRFEPLDGSYRVARHSAGKVFEKWRGIGTGFPIQGDNREAVVAFFRKMRGHDDLD